MKRFKGYITKQTIEPKSVSRGSAGVAENKKGAQVKYKITTRRKGIWNIPDNF